MTKHLLVVESPAKAKTIKRFLGKDYAVEASMGHIRDLPGHTLGVDTGDDFRPTYEVPKEKATVVRRLKSALKEAEDLWIATDEDREGEAIGWHIAEVLKQNPRTVKRIVFHEITASAIREAVDHPRTLSMHLVDAQQARRVLDRLVGYTLSPFLWKKVRQGLSAGRVQSVAVRIIVDREREIRAFASQEYWTIDAHLHTEKDEHVTASLKRKDGKDVNLVQESDAKKVLKELEGVSWSVCAVARKEVQRTPPPPFTTSTLQQEASRKLGFSVKQTMMVAQQLYETGLITYMRTDSVSLSEKALVDAIRVIEEQFGREYVLSSPRRYKTKSKGAQEAHEAIRPTECDRTPQSLNDSLDRQQLKLYTLIWNRTMATQMPPAILERTGVDIEVGAYTFRATGQVVRFDGYFRVYSEGRDETSNEKRATNNEDENEKMLPPLTEGQGLLLDELLPEQHFTKPPPRYTEASLVKKLEEEGIGRPSTYAPTISTILQRGYIEKEGKQLKPTDIAFLVIDLLAEHFRDIVDLDFTAQMEQSLDNISEGKQEWVKFLREFYEPFSALVEKKTKTITRDDVKKERVLGEDGESGLSVYVRLGRFGPYVQVGEMEKNEKGKKVKWTGGRKGKTASVPKHIPMDDVTLDQALSLLAFPRQLGLKDKKEIEVHLGRFGPYIKCGDVTVSIPKEKDPILITKEEAVMFLTEKQEEQKVAKEPLASLGKDSASGKEILVKTGRFGPYVTDGKTNASLGTKLKPEDVTFEKAVELLEKKRKRGPGRRWKGRG
ncbi:DNA topoisomerase I [Candidatus Peribacteria bacterium RIFCSPHIGHO2_02_FULL_49_16]|nr:MAG: DNA topoisomerase I [Candidatus Peribacteria bacterium RIFCSPHIGHO2_01_FULL_49_38]OGJ58661.1 MAG: DNA topoisomerase I [Candidatus Peribacteria bacterium RIFCSPHIGHO2_02_FULL_49_16]